MRFSEFRSAILHELRRQPEGLTWNQLRDQLALPYERPCPTWVARLEREEGLARLRREGPALVWTTGAAVQESSR
jgi:hypothetical protein